MLYGESGGERGKELLRDRSVDEGGLDGVADGGVVGLAVVDDGEGECLIDVLVDINVADAFGVAEDGDAGVGLDVLDQGAGAARYDKVDERRQVQELGDLLAAEDQGDGFGRNGSGARRRCARPLCRA